MLSELETRLWDLLKQQAQGISEFDLLRLLQQQQDGDFGPGLFRDDLSMYRAHFLLFHALYRLRDYLLEQQLGLLDIHVIEIKLTSWQQAETSALSLPDPMREYYLDFSHLEDTTLQDVEALLGDFWARYMANEKRGQALQELGLDADASSGDIERQYKKLAMQRHPDRGGDAGAFQLLQQAITILRRSG